MGAEHPFGDDVLVQICAGRSVGNCYQWLCVVRRRWNVPLTLLAKPGFSSCSIRDLDRPIHMALGCQVHHQIGIGLAHYRSRGRRVSEINLQQLMAVVSLRCLPLVAKPRQLLLDAGELVGLAALVEVEHQCLATAQLPTHHRPANVHTVGRRPYSATSHQDEVATGEHGWNVRAVFSGIGGAVTVRGSTDALRAVAIAAGLGCLGVGVSTLGIWMPRRHGGAWYLTAKPFWKPSLAVFWLDCSFLLL